MRFSICCIALLVACAFAPVRAADAPDGPLPGLKLTLEAKGVTDARVARLVALRVGANEPVSPFIGAGPFKATWEGTVTQRIKDDYTFSAIGNGSLKVTINDAVVLDVSGDGLAGKSGTPVTIKKGKSAFKAEYTSPANGEAAIRLMWAGKGFLAESVPPSIFTHDAADAKLVEATKVRHGRELIAEHRCVKCHTDAGLSADKAAMPELAQDAPSLVGIGSRAKQAFLAKWIGDPKHVRATTAMPRMFKPSEDGKVPQEAADIAAYLVTDGAAQESPEDAKSHAATEGARLFANLGCVGCHVSPDIKDPTTDTPRPRNPLAHVPEKFHRAALVAFLKKPEQHYAWSKMPNFRLADAEAEQLAAYLIRPTDAKQEVVNGDPKRGQELFQSSGCISCHGASVENKFKTKALAELGNLTKGCMAADASQRGSAPDFHLTDADRAAIAAVANEKFASLKQDTPAEFAERQVAMLNCVACHIRDKQDDLLTSTLKPELDTILKDLPPEDHKVEEQYGPDQSRPPLTWVGEKLRPQWAEQFIGGNVPYKPRPWLRARMPGFPARGAGLAHGFAASHGVPTVAPEQPKPDPSLAETGKKLVARQGGFSCVQCHGVGEMKAFAPFEAPAINFAHVSDRLTREYYDRWVYNPQRVLPGTRMPSFADNKGATALKDIFGGDAKQQFDAIWNYLLEGKEIQRPE